jgi:hypothetical protein
MNNHQPTDTELRAGEAAAWGPRPDPAKSRMAIQDIKLIRKNTLRAVFNIYLSNGLRLHNCMAHRNGARCWVSLPAAPRLDRDKRQATDAKGKLQYDPVCQWDTDARRNAWSEAVIKLLLAAHPHALDD